MLNCCSCNPSLMFWGCLQHQCLFTAHFHVFHTLIFCFVRLFILSSPSHAVVSLLSPFYLSPVFLPVSSIVFTLFLVALSLFIWAIYYTAFLSSPHLLHSLIPASPFHSYKIISQILSLVSLGINTRGLIAANWRPVTNGVRISSVGFSSSFLFPVQWPTS